MPGIGGKPHNDLIFEGFATGLSIAQYEGKIKVCTKNVRPGGDNLCFPHSLFDEDFRWTCQGKADIMWIEKITYKSKRG